MKLDEIRKALRTPKRTKRKKDKTIKIELIECGRCGALGQESTFRLIDVYTNKRICSKCDAEDICDYCDRDADFEDEGTKVCSKHHLEHLAKICRACTGTGKASDGYTCAFCDGEGLI